MKYLAISDYKRQIGPAGQALAEILNAGNYSKAVLLVDANSEKFCLPQFASIDLPIIRIEPGEQQKNIRTCEYIWQQMMALGMDRHSLLVNLGGGVIGDMGGFCAATFFRGIPFVQIPTTLLSQVDASIGGKLGIDLNWVKNAVGVFKNPLAVVVDPQFLKTLPDAELRSGFAEIIKHALIADAVLWNQLKEIDRLDGVEWEPILEASLRIKRDVVVEDPFEKGRRKVLNFGHTIGHAIESFVLSAGKPLTHGEAVAAGMVAESYLSSKYLGLEAACLDEIVQVIKRFYPPIHFTEGDYDALLGLMKKDKKNRAGSISFTLLPAIGQASFDQFVSEDSIREALDFYLREAEEMKN